MLKFFRELDGENPTDIYNMVLKEVEQPLLEIVMKDAMTISRRLAKF